MVQFTDAELSVVHTVLLKADPMGLIADVQSIIQKIRAYAEEKNAQQIAAASETPAGE